MQNDAGRQRIPVDLHPVVGTTPRRLVGIDWLDAHRVEELTRRRVAEFALVLEDQQFAGAHFAPGSGAVVVEHLHQGLPEQFQIGVAEARVGGEEGVDEAMHPIERVGPISLRPMVRAWPACFFSCSCFSHSVVTAMRVMDCSRETIGWMERAKASCTGPRTWPALTPVLITAPNMRTSKNVWHIQRRTRSSAGLSPALGLAGFSGSSPRAT